MRRGKRLRAERHAAQTNTAAEAERQERIRSADFSRKLDRAEAHINTLEDLVHRWLESDAYALVEELDPQTGENVLKAKIAKPPGEEWPLIVGDAIHNLRSALDHIAYALALKGYRARNPGQAIPAGHQRRIRFPIVAASNDPRLTVEQFYAQVAVGQLRYVPTPAAARIESVQPYNRLPADAISDPLWIVNELDVIDKHRKLHTVAAAFPLQGMQIGGGDVHIKSLTVGGAAVEDGSEVMRWAIEATSPTPVHVQRQFSRHVTLADGPSRATRAELIDLLRLCLDDVRANIVPVIAPFL